MTTLSKYQRPRTNSKATKKNSTILCSEITPPKIQKPLPNPRRGNPRQTHSLNWLVYMVNWSTSVKQKECSPTKVLCKLPHSHFLIKKHRSKNFLYLKKIICQKFLETISNYPYCVTCDHVSKTKFMRWRTNQFSINYSGGTDIDTKEARPWNTCITGNARNICLTLYSWHKLLYLF